MQSCSTLKATINPHVEEAGTAHGVEPLVSYMTKKNFRLIWSRTEEEHKDKKKKPTLCLTVLKWILLSFNFKIIQ